MPLLNHGDCLRFSSSVEEERITTLPSNDLAAGQPVPPRFALGTYDAAAHVTFAGSVSPELHRGGLPEGTRSLALICVDIDVPTRPEDVNQEGRTVPFDLPRGWLDHWCLANIPRKLAGLPQESGLKVSRPGERTSRAGVGHVKDQAGFTCTYRIFPGARMPS